MSDLQKLEDLYNRNIKIDEEEQKFYRGLLNHLMTQLVIPEMKKTDLDFANLFQRVYYGGSFFDGLKVGSTHQEFDLNIVFKWNPTFCKLVNLNDDKKKNFALLRVTKPEMTGSERKVVFQEGGVDYISPKKMFELVKSSVDRALRTVGVFYYQGSEFRVTRHEYAPVTLKISGPGASFEVDLVPSLQFNFNSLPPEVCGRVSRMSDRYNVTQETRSFMAISLHRADQRQFELDFHDLERRILYDRGCVKKVIKLLKYMRDEKGGPMAKLWSHLLKTSVMHMVVAEPKDYWANDNLPTCFIDSLKNLLDGLRRGEIADVFFPQVNLLGRIKNPQVISDVVGYIERKLRAFKQTGDILIFF